MKIRFWNKETGEEIAESNVLLQKGSGYDRSLYASKHDLNVDCDGNVVMLSGNGYGGLDSYDVSSFVEWDVSHQHTTTNTPLAIQLAGALRVSTTKGLNQWNTKAIQSASS